MEIANGGLLVCLSIMYYYATTNSWIKAHLTLKKNELF